MKPKDPQNRARAVISPTKAEFNKVAWRISTALYAATLVLLLTAFAATLGCGTGQKKKQSEFFTSGSREADQRAGQRMAKAEQLAGSGEGAGEKEKKTSDDKKTGAGADAKAEQKLSLYDRIGGEPGISKIVDDFVTRAMQDPRVNWQRKGAKPSGFFSFRKKSAFTWTPSAENVALLKKHMAQFFALAAGGPAHYEGKDMKSAHANAFITNAEFDAAVGDLKASLDKLQIGNREQKELLAIVESTRPQIVTER